MIRVRQIKVPIDVGNGELNKYISKKVSIKEEEISNVIIKKKSIDARKKENIFFIYEVDVEVVNEEKILKKNKSKDILKAPIEKFDFKCTGNILLENRPVIVGAGPAGLFGAYMLAENGYKPIVIERGEKVEDRVKTVEEFWNKGILNENSNVQFGEGGAGTFSDGKLNTSIKDSDFIGREVLKIFVEAGAPEEILYINKPHIGTDLLREVVKNIRNKIIENGGIIKYNSCLTDIKYEDNKVKEIVINNDEIIKTDVVVLAIGHSARDTFKMLKENKIYMKPKPFAVGVRIQHKQETINNNQYGERYKNKLPVADYKLTYRTSKGRGVYSFCMCPGGFVVNASSEKNRLAINGMSNHERNTENANSAIVVTVSPEDFGENILSGMEFQEKLEKVAYEKGNGKIPIQLYGDFKQNIKSKEFKSVKPIFKGSYEFSNINEILPDFITEALKEGIDNFDSKIKGFSDNDAILAAVESRTSSPVRIVRDNDGVSNIKGIYPCGEGAGYAGGIMSAAIDGIKVAKNIVKVYKMEE